MSSGGHVYKEGNSFLGLVKKLPARVKAAGKSIYSKLITYPKTLYNLPKNTTPKGNGWSAPGRDKGLGKFCPQRYGFFFSSDLISCNHG